MSGGSKSRGPETRDTGGRLSVRGVGLGFNYQVAPHTWIRDVPVFRRFRGFGGSRRRRGEQRLGEREGIRFTLSEREKFKSISD